MFKGEHARRALATDYDGTLATAGAVEPATLGSLAQLRSSGWHLILVTGRVMKDLHSVFAEVDLFDAIVAENGAAIYRPGQEGIKLLAEGPPQKLVTDLRRQGVPLGVGRVIVATVVPHEQEVEAAIARENLPLEVIFNKGAVMVLPKGIDKATGLAAAAADLDISLANVVGVGDAENDGAFLGICGFSAAVANALPGLKEQVDFVCTRSEGEGVRELVELLLSGTIYNQLV